jgi:protein subunit release factor A
MISIDEVHVEPFRRVHNLKGQIISGHECGIRVIDLRTGTEVIVDNMQSSNQNLRRAMDMLDDIRRDALPIGE